MTPQKYIFSKMHEIEGYIDPLDALVFCTLLSAQSKAREKGALFEIGVYFGRSLFLLDLLRDSNERILGADLFITFQEEFGSEYQKRTLLSSAQSLGARIGPEDLLEGDSTKLEPSYILERIGRARFVHLDGGHLTEHVSADARLSAQVLTDSGIICFDDFFNPEWPEVTTAAVEFLQSQSSLVPILITNKKLYVCPIDAAADYRGVLKNAPQLRKFNSHEKRFLHEPIVVLGHPLSRRVLYEGLSRTPLRNLSRHLYI